MSTKGDMKRSEELKVFISSQDSTCGECNANLGTKAWITLVKDKGALCLSCADLDHLVFLPSGDTALTRRAKKNSTLWAVVLKWSRARKRYERQGLLIEEKALQEAEAECLEDREVRERRRIREAERRAALDQEYIKLFAQRVRELFPSCPEGREIAIAEHACIKYSGSIGRTEEAKNLEKATIRLTVMAHIRHEETKYDELLVQGYGRWEAREIVADEVRRVLYEWESRR